MQMLKPTSSSRQTSASNVSEAGLMEGSTYWCAWTCILLFQRAVLHKPREGLTQERYLHLKKKYSRGEDLVQLVLTNLIASTTLRIERLCSVTPNLDCVLSEGELTATIHSQVKDITGAAKHSKMVHYRKVFITALWLHLFSLRYLGTQWNPKL